MLKVDLYNFEGKRKDSINLPKEYEVKPNFQLLLQAIHVYEDRLHLGLARAKTRSEVAISTRKIYRQKGTGGARHGAKSAPIFVGGGVTHGPKGFKRILRLSGSQRNKAFLYALNYKLRDSRIVLVDGLDKIVKTKNALSLIKNIIKDKNWKGMRNVIIVLSKENSKHAKAFRNINGIKVEGFKSLNAYKVYLTNGLIIDREVFVEKENKTNVSESMIKKSVINRSTKTININTKAKVKRIVKPSKKINTKGNRKIKK